MVDPVTMDSRTCRWAEYIDEVTTGTLPTNPAMVAFPCNVTKFEFKHDPISDDYSSMNGPTCATPREHGVSNKVAEDLSFSVTGKATGVDLVPYALMGDTTTTYAIGKVPHYVSIGMFMGTDYAVLKGCLMEELVFDFPSRSATCEMTATYQAMDIAHWGATDYKGTGSHASAVTDTPLNFGSITSPTIESGTFAASNMLLNSLKFGFTNNIEGVENIGATTASKYSIFSIGDIEKTLEMNVTFLDAEVYDLLTDGAVKDFSFALDGKTFTYTNVVLEPLGSVAVEAADTLGASISIKPGTGALTIA